MALKSIFGEVVEAGTMQVIIDKRQDSFRKAWYEQYFEWAPAQVSLDYETIIGRTRVAAAASVTSLDDKAPLRTRPGMEKLKADISPIQEKLSMSQKQYREYRSMQNMPVSDETKIRQILDLIYNDVKQLGEGFDKRLDIMVLEGLSTGQISLTVDNNPDGIVLSQPLDLLMPTGNKLNATTAWTENGASPFDDWAKVIEAAQAAGFPLEKVLMSRTKWLQMSKLSSVSEALIGYNQLQKGAGIVTLNRVNEYLTENQLPTIEIVDVPIPIEKDGVRSIIRPFKDENLVFVPAGGLGDIKNAIPTEKMEPVENVEYADYKRAIISKWHENEPWREWTRIEGLAMPSFDSIENIFLLSTTAAFV